MRYVDQLKAELRLVKIYNQERYLMKMGLKSVDRMLYFLRPHWNACYCRIGFEKTSQGRAFQTIKDILGVFNDYHKGVLHDVVWSWVFVEKNDVNPESLFLHCIIHGVQRDREQVFLDVLRKRFADTEVSSLDWTKDFAEHCVKKYDEGLITDWNIFMVRTHDDAE